MPVAPWPICFSSTATAAESNWFARYVRTLDDGSGIFEQFVVLDMLLGDLVVVLEAPELPEIEAAWSPDGSQIGAHLPTIDERGEGTWDLFRITDWADPAAR